MNVASFSYLCQLANRKGGKAADFGGLIMHETTRRSLIGKGFLIASAGVLPVANANGERARPIIPRRYHTAISDIETFARNQVRSLNLPGLILVMRDRSGWQHHLSLGLSNVAEGKKVSDTHLFQIGSISKSMIALCIFKLVADGKLSLEGKIKDIIPGITITSPGPITVRHLLNHTSGLPSDTPLHYAFQPNAITLSNPPGSYWNYSNTGYRLLGLIVEEGSQRTYNAFLANALFKPLGMHHSKASILGRDKPLYALGYGPVFPDRPFPIASAKSPAPWVNVTGASGSVASTAADMGLYLGCLLRMGDTAVQAILPPDLAQTFISPSTAAPGWEDGAKFAYGLAIIRREGRDLLYHTGGMIGFSSALHADLGTGIGAFASTNVGHATYRPSAITEYACRRLREASTQTVSARSLVVEKGDKRQISSSEYRSAAGKSIRVQYAGESLLFSDGEQRIAYIMESNGYYIPENPAASSSNILAENSERGPAKLIWVGETPYLIATAPPEDFPKLFLLASIAGIFENDDPWFGVVRVSARGERLFLNGTSELYPISAGLFRLGDDPRSPDYVRFHAISNGHPQVLDISGVFYSRRELDA